MSVTVRDYPGGRKEVDIRFQIPTGERIRKKLVAPVTSTSGARAWGEARERDLYIKAVAAATGTALPRSVPTLEKFVPRFMDEFARAEQHKPSGIESKESLIRLHLLPSLGSLRLNEITDAAVQKVKLGLHHLNPKSVNNVLSVLSKLLKVAVAWGVILEMPARITLLKTQDKAMSFYEVHEYAALLESAKAIDWRHEVLLRLGGDLGLRRGEMLGLRAGDIDNRDEAFVHHNLVRGEDHGTKGMRGRRVTMPPDLANLIRTHVKGKHVPVLHQPDGEALTPKMLRGMMCTIQRKAGRADSGALHVLRHTFCSHLAMAGMPVMKIQRLAGHAHLSTTLRYMHLAPGEECRDVVDKLSRLRRGEPSGEP